MGGLRRWLRALARRGAPERELDDEPRYHLGREAESNIAAGMSPEEARLAALRDFGLAPAWQEIGVRIALGARPFNILRQTLVGVAAGSSSCPRS